MLVKKMLDYSQLDNADVNANLAPINLDELPNILSKKYKSAAEKKGVRFSAAVNANTATNTESANAHAESSSDANDVSANTINSLDKAIRVLKMAEAP